MKNQSIMNGLHVDLYKLGTKWYFLNDKLHREDGPAFEDKYGGTKEWRIHGKLHREDGPAIEWGNKDYDYYLDDRRYSEEDYWKEIERRKSLSFILSNLKKDFIKI